MGRSRYTITEPDKPHFLTCTVVEWLPVFTRPETVEILLDCWRYQRENQGLKFYGYVANPVKRGYRQHAGTLALFECQSLRWTSCVAGD